MEGQQSEAEESMIDSILKVGMPYLTVTSPSPPPPLEGSDDFTEKFHFTQEELNEIANMLSGMSASSRESTCTLGSIPEEELEEARLEEVELEETTSIHSQPDTTDLNDEIHHMEGPGLGRSMSTRSAPEMQISVDDTEDNVENSGSDSEVKEPCRIKRKPAIRRNSTAGPNSRYGNNRTRLQNRKSQPNLMHLQSHGLERLSLDKSKQGKDSCQFFTLELQLPSVKETLHCGVDESSLWLVISRIADEKLFDIKAVDIFVEGSSTPLLKTDQRSTAFANKIVTVKEKPHEKALKNAHHDSPFSVAMKVALPMAGIPTDSLIGDDFTLGQPNRGRSKDLAQFLGVNNNHSQQRAYQRRQSLPMLPAKSEKANAKSYALQEQLNRYDIHGLPPFPALLSLQVDRTAVQDEEIFELENSWKVMVADADSLSKKDQDQQEAIWEIIKTERDYIKHVRIIIDIYMCTLLNLQASSILNEIKTEKIFSNIIEIEKLHLIFWRDHIMPLLQQVRTDKLPIQATHVASAFSTFSDLFGPYIRFMQEEGDCVKCVRMLLEENQYFKQYLQWCENLRQTTRRNLADLLVYPMQRLTKYPLLLSAVAKKTLDPKQQEAVTETSQNVNEFIQKINYEVTRNEEQSKVDEALAKIEGYEVPMATGCEELNKLVGEHSTLDLTASMPQTKAHRTRWLLLEGPLKFRDQENKGIDVQGFLFTDVFIITKAKKEKFKIIRPPMKIDRLKVVELIDKTGFAGLVVDEYGCSCYGFIANTNIEGFKWVDKIEKAKELYRYACTEDSDKFLRNVSLTQLSDLNSSNTLAVDDTTSNNISPAPSPHPSPMTPHRRSTTSMFSQFPPDVPGVVFEEEEATHEKRESQSERAPSIQRVSPEHHLSDVLPSTCKKPPVASKRTPKSTSDATVMRQSSTEPSTLLTNGQVQKETVVRQTVVTGENGSVSKSMDVKRQTYCGSPSRAAQSIIAFDDDSDDGDVDPLSLTDPFLNRSIFKTDKKKNKKNRNSKTTEVLQQGNASMANGKANGHRKATAQRSPQDQNGYLI